MSIKNLKPNKDSKYQQGYFSPLNPIKYIGKYPIIFRSGWERKFAIYCDNNPNIVEWASEPFCIQYTNILDQSEHRYYPDFLIRVKTKRDEDDYIMESYIIEIKPSKQLKKPEPPLKRKGKAVSNYKSALKMYLTNLSKVKYMQEYAHQHNMKFALLTEENLNL